MKEANFIRAYVRPFFEKQVGEHGIVHKLQDGRGGEKWICQSPKPADLMISWRRGDDIIIGATWQNSPKHVPVPFDSGFGFVEAKVVKGLSIAMRHLRDNQQEALSRVDKCGHMALIAVRFEFKATKKEKKGTFHKYIEYSELERCGSISFNRDGSVKDGSL